MFSAADRSGKSAVGQRLAAGLLGAWVAVAGGPLAQAGEPQWLLRAGGLEVSDRSLIFALHVKTKAPKAGDRAAEAQAQLERLRARLLLAAAAVGKGYDRDSEVAGPLAEYRTQHLTDVYFEEHVEAPARKQVDDPPGKQRSERGRLFEEVIARARQEFPVTVDEAALAAVEESADDVVVARGALGVVRAGQVRVALRTVDHPSERPRTRATLVRTVLDPMMARLSVAALAEREGYAARADFRADFADRQLRALERRLVEREVHPTVRATPEEVAVLYAESTERLRRGEEREIFEILLPGEAEAKETAARLASGTAFADEVARSSVGLTKVDGGRLGFFQAGETDPKLDAVIRRMRQGEVSAPIQTPYGWHILRCARVVTGRVPSLDEVRGAIEDLVLQSKRSAATTERAALLVTQIPVEVNEARYQQIVRGLE